MKVSLLKKPTRRQRLFFWGIVLFFTCIGLLGINWYMNSTRFVIAARKGDIEQTAYYIHKKYSPNIRIPMKVHGKYSWISPIDASLAQSNPDLVLLLLKAGADPNATTMDGMTLLTAAILDSDKPIIVRHLLQYGANPNQINDSGFFPLQIACMQGQSEDAKTLISYGADVNIISSATSKNKSHYNMLMYCIAMGLSSKDIQEKNFIIPQLLINAGIQRNYKTPSGESPLSLAQKKYPHSFLTNYLAQQKIQ